MAVDNVSLDRRYGGGDSSSTRQHPFSASAIVRFLHTATSTNSKNSESTYTALHSQLTRGGESLRASGGLGRKNSRAFLGYPASDTWSPQEHWDAWDVGIPGEERDRQTAL